MEKITKSDLKRPDIFHRESSKIADWTLKHKRTFISSIGTLVILALAWAGWGFYAESVESKAQIELFQAQKNLKAIEVPKKPEDITSGAGSSGASKTEESYKEALSQLEKVARNFSSTQAGAFAALDYSRITYEFGKYDTSIDLLQKVKDSARGAAPRAIIFHTLGVLYEAKGDCAKAIDQWNQIEARDDMSFMHGTVFINKGLCYNKLGQKDKAEQMFKKAEGLTKNPETVKMAKKYLRLIK